MSVLAGSGAGAAVPCECSSAGRPGEAQGSAELRPAAEHHTCHVAAMVWRRLCWARGACTIMPCCFPGVRRAVIDYGGGEAQEPQYARRGQPSLHCSARHAGLCLRAPQPSPHLGGPSQRPSPGKPWQQHDVVCCADTRQRRAWVRGACSGPPQQTGAALAMRLCGGGGGGGGGECPVFMSPLPILLFSLASSTHAACTPPP